MTRAAFVILQLLALGAMVLGLAAFGIAGSQDEGCMLGLIALGSAGAVIASGALLFLFVKSRLLLVSALIAIFIEALVVLIAPGWIRSQRSWNIDLSDPARTVDEARRIIATAEEQTLIHPADLPPSLQIRNLQIAQAHGDHLDLIMADDIDGHMGFRIWQEGATRPHRDRPTKYAHIYRYVWNDDNSEGPGNQP